MSLMKELLPIRLKTLVGNGPGKVKRSKFIKDLEVGADTVSAWMKGKAYPRTEQLLRICNVLGCEIGYLIDEEQTMKTKTAADVGTVTGLSEEAINLLMKYKDEEMTMSFINYFIENSTLVLHEIKKRYLSDLNNDLLKTEEYSKHIEETFAKAKYVVMCSEESKSRTIASKLTEVENVFKVFLKESLTEAGVDELEAEEKITGIVNNYFDILWENAGGTEKDHHRKEQEFLISDTFMDVVKQYLYGDKK